MARRTETVVIKGTPYDLTQLGGVEARRLSVLFGRVCGPVMAKLTATSLDEEAAKAIGEVLADLDEEKLEPLWKAFAKHAVARPDGKRIVLADDGAFDEHFAGEVFAMWQLFIESAKLNFSGFLAEIFGALGNQEPPKQ